MMVMIQYGVMKGISDIIEKVGNLYINYPQNSKYIFILLIKRKISKLFGKSVHNL